VEPFNLKSDEKITLGGEFSIGISIPITPWIPGSSQSLTIKNTEDASAEAQTTLDSTRKQALLDIQKKVNEALQYAERIEGAELNHRIASRAHELSQQGYRSGLVSQTDLLSARQRMITAKQAAVTAQIAYISAVYNLAAALGLDAEQVYNLYAKQ
jgi:multidrug efflux system outer membrane protein